MVISSPFQRYLPFQKISQLITLNSECLATTTLKTAEYAPYGTVSRNTSHCNFQLLTQISFQIYNFISNITNQNYDIW